MSSAQRPKPRLLLVVVAGGLCLLVAGWQFLSGSSYGAQLGNRSLELSSSQASDTAQYLLSFNLSTAGTLGSVLVQFCSNDPLPGTPCTPPAGFDDSSAAISAQSGPGDFTISSSSTANALILTRTPDNQPVEPLSFTFTGIVNPSSPGTYYARLLTFATSDASGPSSDFGGLAMSINNQVAITAEVPPYLIFCTGVTITGLNCANANGDFIDFGNLSTTHSSQGSSQILVATNAVAGYNVSANGTTMTSGNNIIAAIAGGDVSRPGTAQFGLNLTANSSPPVGSDPSGPGSGVPTANYNQPNIFRFTNGDTILSHPTTDDVRVYTASYLVNVPANQAPGIYVTTLTYVCLANF